MPIVKFLSSYKEDVKTVKTIVLSRPYAGGLDFRRHIYGEMPALKDVHLLGKKAALDKIKAAVKDSYETHHDALEVARVRFERLWKKYDFARVESLMGRKCGKTYCFVSLFNVNPKDIKARSFQVYYKAKDEEAVQTIFHELIHFVYFDVYFEMFRRNPLDKQKTWDLSEITAQIMQDELGLGGSPYPAHRKIIPIFKKLWEESKREGFKTFLRKSVDMMRRL